MILQRWIRQQWQKDNLFSYCLAPLSLLFTVIVYMRRQIMSYRQKKTCRPVVVVGNISAGGNGKTTMVIALTRSLQAAGLSVGIVSKGYGRRYPNVFILMDHSMPADIVGDECALIWQKTQAKVAVGPNRYMSIQQLETAGCDIILTDDGLQDYRIHRDLEIILTSSEGMGNCRLMPSGPLREPLHRLQEADYHIHNLSVNETEYAAALTMQYQISALRNLHSGKCLSPQQWSSDRSVYALCAIGNPDSFMALLRQQGFNVEPIVLPDHAQVNTKNLERLDAKAILLTEKDAIKLSPALIATRDIWVVETNAQMSPGYANMVEQIVKLTKNSQSPLTSCQSTS